MGDSLSHLDNLLVELMSPLTTPIFDFHKVVLSYDSDANENQPTYHRRNLNLIFLEHSRNGKGNVLEILSSTFSVN